MSRSLTLSELHEFRDSNCGRLEEWWKIRSRCQHESLSCLGSREDLLERYELHAFNSENAVSRQSSEDLEKTSDTPLEKLSSTSWISSPVNLSNESCQAHPTRHPWKVIPELSYMNKKMASDDIFRAIGVLMRPTFCFYNHVSSSKLAERLIGLCFLPFTADFLMTCSEHIVKALASGLGLSCKSESKELSMMLERQKLIELFYTVCDSEALHGVTYCNSHFSPCKFPASALCDNLMCSNCCSLHQYRLPCHIHDTPVQFFRYRFKSLIEFEEQFDRNLTIRLNLKESLRKIQLYRVFEGFPVRWDKTKVWFNPSTRRIQHVYLTFMSQEHARDAYACRKSLLKSTELKFSIEHLPETLESIYRRMKSHGIDSSRVVVIYESPSGKHHNSLPPKNQVIPEIISLASSITGLNESSIRAEASTNPLSGNFSVREFYLEFPTSESAQKFFSEQPYFQFLIGHKLSHLIVCPFLKTSNVCLICSRPKECLHDLCAECCGRFSSSSLYSCQLHSPRGSLTYHSLQNRRIADLHPQNYIRKIPEKVAKFHMVVRFMLEEGIFTWYRPRFYLKADSLRSANQELQIVIDSSSGRGTVTNHNKKEGKIFNFLSSPPLVTSLDGMTLTEALDCFGRTFMEFNFGMSEESDIGHNFGKSSLQGNVYSKQDYVNDTSHVGHAIRNSFHFFLAGLDPYQKGLKNLLVKEIRDKLGKVSPDEIILIDKNSLLANLLLLDPGCEANIDSYNRTACVKLQNETDALKLVLGEVNLVLPLSNGHYGSPIIIPSSDLIQFINLQYEEYMRNPSLSIQVESISDKPASNRREKRR
jgi:uncharacterized protein (DUF1330 family)